MKKHYLTEEIRAKWLKALESGNYRQGTHVLYNETTGTYCCLGVLGSICNIKGNFDNTFLSDGGPLERGASSVSGLPMKLQERLSDMNDEGASFKEIAAYIRKNVKSVKVPRRVKK